MALAKKDVSRLYLGELTPYTYVTVTQAVVSTTRGSSHLYVLVEVFATGTKIIDHENFLTLLLKLLSSSGSEDKIAPWLCSIVEPLIFAVLSHLRPLIVSR